MKTEIIKILTFSCMVIVLGTQTLLRGSWKVRDPEPLKPENGSN